MACNHRFIDSLDLTDLDYDPQILVVGTFNPAWPDANYAGWFYGRTRNNYFWDVFPRMFDPNLNLRGEGPEVWRRFCRENKVALTDLIRAINDANQENNEHLRIIGGYSDSAISKFRSFDFTDIVGLLRRHPSITRVYLTRLPGNPFFDGLWFTVQEYCIHNNIRVSNLLTPSGNARYQMGDYKQRNPNDREPLRNFIYESWQANW
jgi:hypothetical protein